jgi:hypothetical protein
MRSRSGNLMLKARGAWLRFLGVTFSFSRGDSTDYRGRSRMSRTLCRDKRKLLDSGLIVGRFLGN